MRNLVFLIFASAFFLISCEKKNSTFNPDYSEVKGLYKNCNMDNGIGIGRGDFGSGKFLESDSCPVYIIREIRKNFFLFGSDAKRKINNEVYWAEVNDNEIINEFSGIECPFYYDSFITKSYDLEKCMNPKNYTDEFIEDELEWSTGKPRSTVCYTLGRFDPNTDSLRLPRVFYYPDSARRPWLIMDFTIKGWFNRETGQLILEQHYHHAGNIETTTLQWIGKCYDEDINKVK